MRRNVVLVSALVLSSCIAPALDATKPYVPTTTSWAVRTPEGAGMNAGKLQEAVDYALAHETTQIPDDPGVCLRDRFAGQPYQDIVGPTAERGGVNGIILKGGYIVAEFGDTDREDMTFSVTKSYLATVAGLAFDDDLIRVQSKADWRSHWSI